MERTAQNKSVVPRHKRWPGKTGQGISGGYPFGLPSRSQATFYMWKRQYAGLGVQELRELRSLREENGRLRRIVADLTLDRQILQEIVSKKL